MRRAAIQEQIAQLTREINEEVERAKLPENKTRTFPGFTWTLAAIAFIWRYFGDRIPELARLHREYGEIGLHAGLVLAAIAAVQTLLWIFQSKPASDDTFKQSSARIRELQERRRDLEIQLKEFDTD